VAHSTDLNLNMDWTFSSIRHWGESAAGNWTVTVSDLATGNLGTLTSATLTLYGTNTAAPTAPPVISSSLSSSGNVESAFSYQITATNNPQTFAASGLPDGLSMSSSGLIQGTPTQQGTFNITLGATNFLGTGTATLVLTIGDHEFFDGTGGAQCELQLPDHRHELSHQSCRHQSSCGAHGEQHGAHQRYPHDHGDFQRGVVGIECRRHG